MCKTKSKREQILRWRKCQHHQFVEHHWKERATREIKSEYYKTVEYIPIEEDRYSCECIICGIPLEKYRKKIFKSLYDR